MEHHRLRRGVVRRLPGGDRRLAERAVARYEEHVRRSMAHPELFAEGVRLPRGYGRGLSERAVEFGWVAAQAPTGNVLDAGSALNHAYVLDVLRPRMQSLTILTLAPEEQSFPDRDVRYVYDDLRRVRTLEGESFDTVVCISTLEHVGMDNRMYGAGGTDGDAAQGAREALRELVRLTRPGGTVLFTVPFGGPTPLGWVRQFDRKGLHELIAAVDAASCSVQVYRDAGDGWRSTSEDVAEDATFRTHQAEAVACVRIDLPQRGSVTSAGPLRR